MFENLGVSTGDPGEDLADLEGEVEITWFLLLDCSD